MTRKIFHAAALIVTWGTLLFAAALVIPGLAGYRPYVVLSGSMEPSVRTGSLAYISTANETRQAGSVIAYELSDGTAVIHRIVGVDAETGDYITKEDSNEDADGTPVPEASVLGVYVFSIPAIGYFLQELRIPMLLPLCSLVCVILALNLADYAFCNVRAEDKDSKAEQSPGNGREGRNTECLKRG